MSWDDGSKLDCYNPIKLSVNPINLANLGMVFTSHGDFGDGSLVYHMILFVIRSCPKMFWGACAASKEWRLGRVPGEWWRNAQCTKTWDYTLLELNMLEIPFVCCQISKIMFQQYLIWLLSPLLFVAPLFMALFIEASEAEFPALDWGFPGKRWPCWASANLTWWPTMSCAQSKVHMLHRQSGSSCFLFARETRFQIWCHEKLRRSRNVGTMPVRLVHI